jgi:hypothetical protein
MAAESYCAGLTLRRDWLSSYLVNDPVFVQDSIGGDMA